MQTQLIKIPGYLDRLIPLEEVSYLLGDGAYTKVVFLDSSWLLCSANLMYFEKQQLATLIRCHKSFMVVLTSVEEFIISEHYTTDNNQNREIKLVMPDRSIIPVSRRNEYCVSSKCKDFNIPIGFDFDTNLLMTKKRLLNLTQPIDWLM